VIVRNAERKYSSEKERGDEDEEKEEEDEEEEDTLFDHKKRRHIPLPSNKDNSDESKNSPIKITFVLKECS
jgi:hypothetical protein